jgi:hypothetical protein
MCHQNIQEKMTIEIITLKEMPIRRDQVAIQAKGIVITIEEIAEIM